MGTKTATATLLDGRAIAARMRDEVHRAVAGLPERPRLGVIWFRTGASELYKAAQEREAARLGIEVRSEGYPVNVPAAVVEERIAAWNADPAVHGLFVHQPLPPQIDAGRLSTLIEPRKDIEGIHPQNAARRFFAKARIGSCTALAVMELIESTGVDLHGKEAVVVGHSEIVGRPVGMLLLDQMATTTVCHLGTSQAGRLEEHVRRAEILVVAIGRPEFIRGTWIKPGAIVIDVGINVLPDGRVVGDVEREAARQRAAFLSPVPGGVGPVTVMMVMRNTVEAFNLRQGGGR